MGFRAFDLDALSEPRMIGATAPATPEDLVVRGQAASAQDSLAAHRWDDDGGSIAKEAEAKW